MRRAPPHLEDTEELNKDTPLAVAATGRLVATAATLTAAVEAVLSLAVAPEVMAAWAEATVKTP